METASIDALIMEGEVIEALRACYDPEIPINIYDLGLIYEVSVAPAGAVAIKMTLTAPSCPAAQLLPQEVASRVRAVPGVTAARVDVVWDPPWDPSKMSDVAKLQLGML
ncbi:MAG: DUF59 domain-containing protein [Armatimonadetes bacterium]|nr:DUF59 domain-containing protein [Armatimonadota bacterium]